MEPPREEQSGARSGAPTGAPLAAPDASSKAPGLVDVGTGRGEGGGVQDGSADGAVAFASAARSLAPDFDLDYRRAKADFDGMEPSVAKSVLAHAREREGWSRTLEAQWRGLSRLASFGDPSDRWSRLR